MSKPKLMALAYRIWAYATPREWDVTLAEIADELDEDINRVRAVVQHRGWLGRIRKATAGSGPDSPYSTRERSLGGRFTNADTFIDELQQWS